MNNREIDEREPLIYDWLLYIQQVEQTRQRVIKDGKEFFIPFMAIPMQVVKTVFTICEHFKLPPNTRYIALYLYDKFMCDNFWEAYNNNGKSCPDTGTWEQTSQRISNQSHLRLMSCIQIASKVDSHSNGLSISQVIRGLRRLDHTHLYTPNAVFSSEFKVFKTIGFKIPLATSLDCVEILIAATGVKRTIEFYQVAINLLDLSYLQHHQLYAHLQFVAHGRVSRSEEEKKNSMAMETNIIYLGASIVLCATLILNYKRNTIDKIAERLSDLVDIDQNDIWIMANVLFAMGCQTTDTKSDLATIGH